MSKTLIQDYLNTQGLRLPVEMVQVAYLTLGAVFNVAEVDNLPTNLWQDPSVGFDATSFLNESVDANQLLRSVYAVLDSTLERFPAKVAFYMTADRAVHTELALQRVWHNQVNLPATLQAAEHGHLQLYRAAETGWGRLIDNGQHWWQMGEISEAESHLGWSQMLLPVCAPTGAVLGMLCVTSPEAHAFDDDAKAWWVAASLVLADAVYNFFPPTWWEQEDNDDIPTGN